MNMNVLTSRATTILCEKGRFLRLVMIGVSWDFV